MGQVWALKMAWLQGPCLLEAKVCDSPSELKDQESKLRLSLVFAFHRVMT